MTRKEIYEDVRKLIAFARNEVYKKFSGCSDALEKTDNYMKQIFGDTDEIDTMLCTWAYDEGSEEWDLKATVFDILKGQGFFKCFVEVDHKNRCLTLPDLASMYFSKEDIDKIGKALKED